MVVESMLRRSLGLRHVLRDGLRRMCSGSVIKTEDMVDHLKQTANIEMTMDGRPVYFDMQVSEQFCG